MNELSLFTGAGGGVLGSKLLGHRVVGYVENNDYRQRVIAQRIEDGIFDEAPIFGDIRAFNNSGYAGSYSGLVDVITAGFPCQPFSTAGKRLEDNDERNMWPETAIAISTIKPQHVLLENVPGISKYLPVVIRDLRRIGYTVKRPTIIAAASLGAGHIRRRVWIYAYIDERGLKDSKGISATKETEKEWRSDCMENSTVLSANTYEMRELQQKGGIENKRERSCDTGWWSAEPRVVRVVYGVPNGMDRIASLGDAQIPIMAAFAFEYLRAVIERQ